MLPPGIERLKIFYVSCYALQCYFQHKKCMRATTEAGVLEVIRCKVCLYSKFFLNGIFDEVVGAASFSLFLTNRFLFECTHWPSGHLHCYWVSCKFKFMSTFSKITVLKCSTFHRKISPWKFV